MSRLIILIRAIVTFAAAVLATAVLGSAIATQFIMFELQRMQIDVPAGVRLEATFHDILGMTPLYAMIVAGAMLVTFPIAFLAARFTPMSRRAWLMIGGFAGVVAALLLVKAMLGGTPIAGARGLTGLAGQGLAGLAGGWLFAKLWSFGEKNT
jgi:hypothetical protein